MEISRWREPPDTDSSKDIPPRQGRRDVSADKTPNRPAQRPRRLNRIPLQCFNGLTSPTQGLYVTSGCV